MKIPPSFLLQIWLTFGGKTDLTIGIDIAAQISIVITALATVTSLFASFIGVLFSIGAIMGQPQFRSKHQWRKQVQTLCRSVFVFFTDVRKNCNYNGLFSCQIQAWITGIVRSILRPSIKMRDDMVGGGVMSTFAESLSSGVLTCQKYSRCQSVCWCNRSLSVIVSGGLKTSYTSASSQSDGVGWVRMGIHREMWQQSRQVLPSLS